MCVCVCVCVCVRARMFTRTIAGDASTGRDADMTGGVTGRQVKPGTACNPVTTLHVLSEQRGNTPTALTASTCILSISVHIMLSFHPTAILLSST